MFVSLGLIVLGIGFGCFEEVSSAFHQKLVDDLFDDLLKIMQKIKGPDSAIYKDLMNMMIKIKSSNSCKDVVPAFGASLARSVNLAPGEVVRFDNVWTNIGNCYNPNSGIFIAPKAGVYYFSCTGMTPNNKLLRLHLIRNSVKTVSLYPGSSGYNMGTLSMVLKLRKGDRVFIRHRNISGEQYLYSEGNSNFSMFTGYLISQ